MTVFNIERACRFHLVFANFRIGERDCERVCVHTSLMLIVAIRSTKKHLPKKNTSPRRGLVSNFICAWRFLLRHKSSTSPLRVCKVMPCKICRGCGADNNAFWRCRFYDDAVFCHAQRIHMPHTGVKEQLTNVWKNVILNTQWITYIAQHICRIWRPIRISALSACSTIGAIFCAKPVCVYNLVLA